MDTYKFPYETHDHSDLESGDGGGTELPEYASQTTAPLLSDDSDALISQAGLIRVDLVHYVKHPHHPGYGMRQEFGSVLLNHHPSLPVFLESLETAIQSESNDGDLKKRIELKGIRMRDHGPTLTSESWDRVGARLARVETRYEKSEYGKMRDKRWWRTFWISLVVGVVVYILFMIMVIWSAKRSVKH